MVTPRRRASGSSDHRVASQLSAETIAAAPRHWTLPCRTTDPRHPPRKVAPADRHATRECAEWAADGECAANPQVGGYVSRGRSWGGEVGGYLSRGTIMSRGRDRECGVGAASTTSLDNASRQHNACRASRLGGTENRVTPRKRGSAPCCALASFDRRRSTPTCHATPSFPSPVHALTVHVQQRCNVVH